MSFSRVFIIAVSGFIVSCSGGIKSSKSSLAVGSLHSPCKTESMYKNASEMLDSLYRNRSQFNPNCISPFHRQDRVFLRELVYSRAYSNEDIFNIADKNLRKDPIFIRDVVVANDENYEALAYADKSLREDRAFMLEMLKVTSYSLKYADDSLKKDKNFVWEAVKGKFGHSALKNSDTSIRKDKYFVLAVIGMTSGEVLRYADESLKKDKDVVLAAVKTYPEAMVWANSPLQ